MIIIIDNYDSFTYNLVQYLKEIDVPSVEVYRNNAITIAEIKEKRPHALIISPGPGRPFDAGISLDVIQTFSGKTPILGVCLGHQAIAQVFGSKIVQATQIVHGKTSFITHDGKTIFSNLPSSFKVTRYHSLIVEDVPRYFEVSAKTLDGEIMAIRHQIFALEGVQFHPEAILTEYGREILMNFFKEYVPCLSC